MDNRHQSEREYIRYHAATSGEHLVAGIHGLAHGESRDDKSPALLPQLLRALCTRPTVSGPPNWGACVPESPPSCPALPALQLKWHRLWQAFIYFHTVAHTAAPSCSLASVPQVDPVLEYRLAASRLAFCLPSVPSEANEM